jgi:hypothetical protein
MMRKLVRFGLLFLAGFAATACDDDDGPTGPTRADVAGIYRVCQLTFVPAGALASVNLLDTAFETQNTQVQRPELRLDRTRNDIELVYTPRGEFVSRSVRGTYDLSGQRVTLRFPDSARNALLLPERLTLNFQTTPRQLATASSDPFTVPRADYARLSGQAETNLAPQIEGRLSATFRENSCG